MSAKNPEGRRITAGSAISRGLRNSLGSPVLLLWLWLVTLLVALPAGVAMHESVRSDLGLSLAGEGLVGQIDRGWLEEFEFRARGFEKSLGMIQLSSAAVLENLEGWWSGRLFTMDRGLVALAGAHLLVWILMLGGLLQHLAKGGGRLKLHEFFAAGARHFGPLLRLTILSGFFYFAVFRLARRLFPWIEDLTRDVTRETTALAANLAGVALVLILLALLSSISDFAKISIVTQNRRSAVLASVRGLVFVLRRPLRVAVIRLSFGLLLVLLIGLYVSMGPGSGQASWLGVAGALLVGQAYLLARTALRVSLLAAQLDLARER